MIIITNFCFDQEKQEQERQAAQQAILHRRDSSGSLEGVHPPPSPAEGIHPVPAGLPGPPHMERGVRPPGPPMEGPPRPPFPMHAQFRPG